MATQFTFNNFDRQLFESASMKETVVQLKMSNDPIKIWKRRYQDKPLRFIVSAVDLRRKDSDVTEMQIDEETNSNDMFINSPTIKISTLDGNNWKFKSQETIGHLYNGSEFVILSTQMIDHEKTGYKIDFYTQITTSNTDNYEQIGFSYILQVNMVESMGTCTMPVTGMKNLPIGQITIDYLIIKPLIGYHDNNSHFNYASIWMPTKSGFDIGHRGAGNARRTDKIENVLENTIASFNYASAHGADMVELDVQLSKDKVPVIYHDYNINVFTQKKKNNNEPEVLQIPIHDLTQNQLQSLKMSPVHKAKKQYDFSEHDSDDNQPFPTLKQVFESVDDQCGFNVEIKYPQQKADKSWEAEKNIDLNEYVDIILKTILEYAGHRYIIISCFHPDVCSMVRLKQNRYPLVFLTQGQTKKWLPFKDQRAQTVQMGAYFVLSMGILGINVHAEEFLRERSLISFVKSHRLVLFCWGEDLNKTDLIEELKEDGVDGVIYDKVDVYSKKVFISTTSDRLELFEVITGRKSNQSFSKLANAKDDTNFKCD